MKTAARLALALILVAGPLLGTAPGDQTTPFSHRLHVLEEELSCLDCHAAAWQSARSGDDLNPKAEL